MIPHAFREKGGAPLLGAKGSHQRGPFGVWPDLGEDDVQADEAGPRKTVMTYRAEGVSS